MTYVTGNAMALDSLDEARVDLRYLVHALTPERLRKAITGSAQPQITRESLRSVSVPLPPVDEQRRIAAVLDRADAIRTAQRAMLTRLEVLTHAVFRRMFMEDEVTRARIGSFADVRSGSTPSREEPDNYGGQIPWVKTGEVDGIITQTSEFVTEKGIASARLRVFPAGSVVVAMYGQGKTRGKSGILGMEATTNQACAVIVLNENFDPLFLQTQLSLEYERLRRTAEGGNQPNLSLGRVQQFEVLLPSIEAQRTFAALAAQIEERRKSLVRALASTDLLVSSLQTHLFTRSAVG